MENVPVIDISSWSNGSEADKDATAAAINEACTKWGFLLVSGHGISSALVEKMFDVTYRFFDLSEEEKQQYDSTGRPGGRGYFSLGAKSLARSMGDAKAPGDRKETFFTGMEPVAGDPYYAGQGAKRHFANNVWPQVPGDMEETWNAYRSASESLSGTLLSLCARALELPDDWFEALIDKPISTLVAHHYPPQSEPPVTGALRSGAHTDFGTLTLLMTENRPGGLQVMGLDGQWHDIVPVPGAFIVNLGDMMSRWTNHQWRSTLHRVVNPPEGSGMAARRLSIVYFHTPNYDAEITCVPSTISPGEQPKYPPILAGDHLTAKLSQTDSGRKAAAG